jgi:hypothetical protein
MNRNKFYITCFLLLLCFFQGRSVQAQKGIVLVQTDGTSYITGEQVWCSIRISDPVSGKPWPSGHIIYGALLDDKGAALIQVRFASDDGMATGYIPLPAALVSGVYLITAITGDASIPFPLKPILVINPNKPPIPVKDSPGVVNSTEKNAWHNIAVRPEKQQYGRREKISIDIEAGDQVTAKLSMSVRRVDTLEAFADSLLAGMDLATGTISNTTLSSREGQFLKARVFPVNSTSPAANVRVFVSVIGTEAKIAEAVSNENGELIFLLPLLYADAQLVFMPVQTGNTVYRVEFNPDALEQVPGVQVPRVVLPDRLAGPIRNRVIEAQAQAGFRPEEKTMLVINNPDTTDFYGRPDKRYMLDNYTRFPNMEEIITEFVTEVRIRKNKEMTELQVVNAPYKKFFEEPALVLIDGIPVTDIRKLLDLDPLKLQSIDIISHRFFMGNHSYPGIIQYKSYQGNLGGYTLPVDAAVYSFEGAQLQKEYLSPDYSASSDNRIPDFRNLLYWNPGIQTDKNGKMRVDFYSGDLDGHYKIILNGVSETGKALNGSASIEIK